MCYLGNPTDACDVMVTYRLVSSVIYGNDDNDWLVQSYELTLYLLTYWHCFNCIWYVNMFGCLFSVLSFFMIMNSRNWLFVFQLQQCCYWGSVDLFWPVYPDVKFNRYWSYLWNRWTSWPPSSQCFGFMATVCPLGTRYATTGSWQWTLMMRICLCPLIKCKAKQI